MVDPLRFMSRANASRIIQHLADSSTKRAENGSYWGSPPVSEVTESRFDILPRRWVAERTFAWLDQNRRLSKDYERLPATSETFVYLAMSRFMLRRLARQQTLKAA